MRPIVVLISLTLLCQPALAQSETTGFNRLLDMKEGLLDSFDSFAFSTGSVKVPPFEAGPDTLPPGMNIPENCALCALAYIEARAPSIAAQLGASPEDDLTSLFQLARLWLASLNEKANVGLTFLVQDPFKRERFKRAEAMAVLVVMPVEAVNPMEVGRWSIFELTMAYDRPNLYTASVGVAGDIALQVTSYREARRAAGDTSPSFSREWRGLDVAAEKQRLTYIVGALETIGNAHMASLSRMLELGPIPSDFRASDSIHQR
jgi:hypothetical protein